MKEKLERFGIYLADPKSMAKVRKEKIESEIKTSSPRVK